MCGIAALVNKDGRPASAEALRVLMADIEHRGPDGVGYFSCANVGLGHRRLRIIDLSDAGNQPMTAAGQPVHLVYNGEIYNYLELRSELISLGHHFTTDSDSEVLLQAYLAWGIDCTTHFNGMWSFALLDYRKRRLFCSRDRFGEKPLYYCDRANQFVAASEIRQLLPFLSERRANREHLVDFLLTSITDHSQDTFFRGVKKVPAGHNLIFSLDKNTFELSRYYRVTRSEALRRATASEAIEEFSGVLESSVNLRLRSDVEVGTCLSGGLDSSSIATLAAGTYATNAGRAFSAITAVSTQASNDESAFAKTIVDHSGLNWIQVKPSFEDFQTYLPSVVCAQEEPFGGPSIIMQYAVMRAARAHGITVLLDGQGGDETLLGYPKYYAAALWQMLNDGGVVSMLRLAKNIIGADADITPLRLLMYAIAGLSARSRYHFYRWRHRYLRACPAFPDHLRAFARGCRNVFELQVLEHERTNLPVLLRYEDKNSMANSVEARLPFLDHRVVETALSLPTTVKVRDGWTKWLLRQMMSERMPSDVVWRRNKFGFEAPELQWLSRHDDEMRRKIVGSELLKELCDMSALRKGYARLPARARWRLYSTALWEEAFSIAA